VTAAHQKRAHGCSAGCDRVGGGAAARRVGWLLRLVKSGADGRASDHLPLRRGAAVTRWRVPASAGSQEGDERDAAGNAPIAQRLGRRISPPVAHLHMRPIASKGLSLVS
jgi:hypothetical protein